MPLDFKNTGERYAQRAKRRKINIILNTTITIVIILILVVGGNIFFGGNKEGQNPTEKNSAPNTDSEQNNETADKPDKEDVENNENPTDDQSNQKPEEDQTGTDEEADEIIETDSNEQNVEKVIVNPSWKPVGTEQVGEHQRSTSKGTVDWNEQMKAISYAVDIPEDNMIVWWIEGGANRDKQAVATVSTRNDTEDAFRVDIEWVEGEGWKPTEVKKLIVNDKGKR